MNENNNDRDIIGFGGKGARYTDNTAVAGHRRLKVIYWDKVKELVDTPPSVPKENGDWVVFNDSGSRLKENIKDGVMYYGLWADIDEDIDINFLADTISRFINGSDLEIYNTRSATASKRKCRCIIPLGVSVTPDDWVLLENSLNNYLSGLGIKSDRVSENLVQLCYLPNKGEEYKVYSIRENNLFDPGELLKKIDRTVLANKDNSNGSSSKIENSCDINQIIDVLVSGGTGYHEAQLKYSFGQLKDGVMPAVIKATLKGFMKAWESHGDHERWQSRYDEIDRIVDGAKLQNGRNSVYLDDIEWKDIEIDRIVNGNYKGVKLPFPMPPGLLGKFYKNLYDMQIYQHIEFSHVTAIGMIAGICGRRFNIDDLGLNVYLMILADTARGKDFIGKTIRRVLSSSSDMGLGISFIGGQRFTAGKGLAAELYDNRSQICVFTEAGLLFQSRAGDQANLTKGILSLYSMSGEHDYTGKEVFSDKENGIKSMRSPALSIISESTPSTIMDSLHNGNFMENGLLPRNSLYRITGEKPYPNMNPETEVHECFIQKIADLISECSPYQNDSIVFKARKFEWYELEDNMQDFWRKCIQIENNENKDNNTLKGIMASRILVKAKKYAAIATLFNYRKGLSGGRSDGLPLMSTQDVPLAIGAAEWTWAKNIVLYELENTLTFFGNSDFVNQLEDLIRSPVYETMVRMFKKDFSSKQICLTPAEIDGNMIPFKKLAQALKQNSNLVKGVSGVNTPIEGLERVLQYMEQMGYLDKIEMEENKYASKVRFRGGIYTANDVFIVKKSLISAMGV